MDIHQKEALQDFFSLIGNIVVLGGLFYLVFFLGHSAWWFLTYFVFRFAFSPSEYLFKKKSI